MWWTCQTANSAESATPLWAILPHSATLSRAESVPASQVETLKATTGGKPITYKIAYGLPVEVMLEWGLYISKPRCRC